MYKIFLFFLIPYLIFSQKPSFNEQKFDSLQKVFFDNIYSNPENAFRISKQANELTFKNNILLCKGYQMSGISYLLLGKSDSSKFFFKKSINKAKQLKDKKYFIDAVISYSNLEVDNIHNKELLSYIYLALDYVEEYKSDNVKKGKLLMFLAEISFNNKEYNKAKKQYKLALKYADSLVYSAVYRGLESIEYKNKNYVEALSYSKKSLKYIGQKRSINQAVSLLRVGRNYQKLNKNLVAEKYFLESKKLQSDIGIKSIYSETALYLAAIERKRKEKNKELKYLNLAEKSSRKSRNYFQLKDIYFKLYNYHSRYENYSDEDFFLNKYITLNDSLYNEEQNSLKLNIETKYLVSQKEKEILFKDQLLKKEGALKVVFISSSAILFLFLILIYILLKKKNDTQKKLNNEEIKLLFEKQKFEIIKEKIKSKNLERQEISKELHDGVANRICSLKILLSDQENKLKSDGILDSIDKLYDEIRGLSHDTIPNYISKVEFTDLIIDLKQQTNNSIEINSYFHQKDKINALHENILFNSYRIIQESITNTIKYAQASKIDISIIFFEQKLTITIEDNGIGFSNNIEKKSGLGLKNIEMRINEIKGTHIIKSSPTGVKTEITIPINYE